MVQRVAKGTMLTSLHGNRNKGFTLIELIVVLAIIALMSLIVYPSFKRGMESIKEQKEKVYLEMLFKRALINSRFNGKATIVSVNDNGALLIDGKQPEKQVSGIRRLEIDGKKVKSIAIVPVSFFTAGIVFADKEFSIDLYTGETEVKRK